MSAAVPGMVTAHCFWRRVQARRSRGDIGRARCHGIPLLRASTAEATIDWQHTDGKPARDMTLAALDDCIGIARTMAADPAQEDS